jgi:hypothetical protein
MAGNTKAKSFLDALNKGPPKAERPIAGSPGRQKTSTDPSRKHIGGYFDPDFVERFAVLKARLGLDNSELMIRAIAALWADEEARRAFSGQ